MLGDVLKCVNIFNKFKIYSQFHFMIHIIMLCHILLIILISYMITDSAASHPQIFDDGLAVNTTLFRK